MIDLESVRQLITELSHAFFIWVEGKLTPMEGEQ